MILKKERKNYLRVIKLKKRKSKLNLDVRNYLWYTANTEVLYPNFPPAQKQKNKKPFITTILTSLSLKFNHLY